MKIYPVILAGGSGTRLWPLSREAMPKQLLPLRSQHSMLQETLLRLADWPELMPPLLTCGNEHRFMVAEQLRGISMAPLAILLEPESKNTAPTVAVAAHFLLQHLQQDEDAIMLVLPADHVIGDVQAFHKAVQCAAQAVEQGALATFGIVPSAAETGYGYIRRAKAAFNGIDGCYAVEKFIEKPDKARAETFAADAAYSWNSGMFLFQPARYLAELREYRPAIAESCAQAFQASYHDLDFCRLDEAAFATCPAESIDYAVMENTRHAVVVPADIGWSDIGSWSALWQILDGDADGNVLRGDVYTDGVRDSMIRAESRFVAVIGMQDTVVVETKDAVLVVHKDQVQGVKKIVEALKKNGRTEHMNHIRVYRPWGCYEGIDGGDRFQVKRITVNPGGKLSLQMHHHRAEHWVVVSGTARIVCGDEEKFLTENESTYIPIGVRHRLENPGKLPLHLIEVQSGSYLGEDDIVRFEDIYKRC